MASPTAVLFTVTWFAYVVSNGWKWRSGWRSRCFPLITSWQCPIWCGRAAATITDFLPTGNKQRRQQGKMGWDGLGIGGMSWADSIFAKTTRFKLVLRQIAWSWDVKISHGSTSRVKISEARVQRIFMEAKGRTINSPLQLIDCFDTFQSVWTFLTVLVKLTEVTGRSVTDEREAKADLKPMTCLLPLSPEGGAKDAVSNRQAWETKNPC